MPPTRIQPGGTREKVFREVARQRFGDAGVLLEEGHFGGAIYLAGYAIECHLKFAICARKTLVYLPAQLEVHDWDTLVDAAGLAREIEDQEEIVTIYSMLADAWGPSLRYRTRAYPSRDAERLYIAIQHLYQFLAEVVP